MRRIINKTEFDILLNSGKTYSEIAEILNFTTNSIGRFYRKHYGILTDRGKSIRQSINITQQQKEIIFGSLLGDMHIQKHNKNYRGNVVHSYKQENYAKHIYNLLSPLVGKFRYVKVKASNKIYDENAFVIRPNLQLKEFYDIFYEKFNGKKDVPYNLDLLTPQAIAIWFMDDGFLLKNDHNSKSLGFSTCSFSEEGLIRLHNFLQNKYNIETIIRKNNYLIVRKKSAQRLKSIIEPFIIDEMKYKINLD